MIVYKTTNLLNGKFYVGKDSHNDPTYLGSGKLLRRAFKKYGIENFKKEIIDTATTDKELNKKEIFWIFKLNAIKEGYNIAVGGSGGDTISNNPDRDIIAANISKGNKGKKFTEETKSKMSDAAILRGDNRKPGWKHTDETRAKMKAAWGNRGEVSDSTKKKMSIAQKKRAVEYGYAATGYKWTKEQKEAHSKRRKGKGGFNTVITNIETTEVIEFPTATLASKYFNCNIGRILNNSLKGYIINIQKQ